MAANVGMVRRLYLTIGAVRTGIILLILVGIASALGTVILQRPSTDAEEIQRAYSPQLLSIMDATQLTSIYHSWWYLSLLALLAISIVCASLERWPGVWRYYSRPYRHTDAAFRAALPLQKSLPISDPHHALNAVVRVWSKNGLKPESVVEHGEVSLYAESHRFAVMAVYAVHASLLLIMLGGLIDGIWGFQGYLKLVPGKPAVSRLDLRDGSERQLQFAVRCDEAGQENYTGQYSMVPRRWWSRLAVIVNGREVQKKEIAVNDPLVYQGVRFFQSGYGTSGELRFGRFAAIREDSSTAPANFKLAVNEYTTLPDGTVIRLAKFIPDAYALDGGIYQRSADLGTPAIKLEITKDGNTQDGWLLPSEETGMSGIQMVGPYDAKGESLASPFQFLATLDMAPFTGLQVSHEPGQWAVWTGCFLMALGLILAFYVLHKRFWALVVTDKQGRLMLWMGAAANKKREVFDNRFRQLADEIKRELEKPAVETTEVAPAAMASD